MRTTRTRTKQRRPLSDAEREQRRAEQRQLVTDAVEQLRSSDGWRGYLRARRHFHAYSVGNQLLIALQRPDATRVAGFRTWLKLGYCVRKGSTSIKIWARCDPSHAKLKAWRNAGADPNQQPKSFYRLVSVFDVADVDPLPPPAEPADLTAPTVAPVTGDSHAQLLEVLTRLSADHGYQVNITELPGGLEQADGCCNRQTKTITLAPRLDPNAQVATLIHELAHALIPLVDNAPVLSYAEEELVVESVAWCVCDTAGLDTTTNSIPYLTSWSATASLDVLQQTAELVDRLTREIETPVLAAISDEADPSQIETG
jgi:hypothetical protein